MSEFSQGFLAGGAFVWLMCNFFLIAFWVAIEWYNQNKPDGATHETGRDSKGISESK